MTNEERREQDQVPELNADQASADNRPDDPIPFRETFGDMPDEEIVRLCHEGDTTAEEYLLNKYKNFVRSKARSYFLIGADHEDIFQEGMIGLY